MAGRRQSLAELAAKNADPAPGPAAPLPQDQPAAPEPTAAERGGGEAPAPKAVRGRATPARAAGGAPRPGQWARYDQYERKEARVRPDQYGQLGQLSRTLNRTRNREGERITENTLIRVAIDLLLARNSDLHGTTEAELRASLGL